LIRRRKFSKFEGFQRGFQSGIAEGVSAAYQLHGFDPLASEKNGLSHLPERQPDGKRRKREECRAREDAGKCLGEFRIGDGPGSDEVDGALDEIRFDRVMDSADHVLNGNPAHPLTAVADASADTHFEREQHLSQRTTFAGEDDTRSHLDRTDACLSCGMSGGFPFAADVGKESRTGRALFIEDFVAAIAVVPDGGTADKNLWLLFRPRQSFGEIPRAENATFADPLPAR